MRNSHSGIAVVTITYLSGAQLIMTHGIVGQNEIVTKRCGYS